MDALVERKCGPERPCFLTAEQQNELKQVILTSSPSDHRLGCVSSWTTPIIREYVRNTYDVEMSCTGILRMLWRLRSSYTRPTYVLAKADPEKQQAFEREIDLIKKLLNNDTVLLYQDETHVRAYQSLHATWSEVGKQKQMPTYGHHASVTLFDTLNAMTGEVLHQTSSSCKQEDFLSFLQLVANHYKDQLIAMVVDNSKIRILSLRTDGAF
ncbi:DDE superfamily endonuclease [Anoxybacillus vitaminiphilus]|uniref:DDE superfamily endonuclease n=1 Tax=Paranoxybacillus vitaminiphilus TaxID=581036 RepID=A0A327Y8Q9_9BACL|nr:IS630 family transposase [Anoxybacillus vitaminiphilus]RAK14859.1 DDE superfamily endonuclease [Anoxybacillus vitaminiphilus]